MYNKFTKGLGVVTPFNINFSMKCKNTTFFLTRVRHIFFSNFSDQCQPYLVIFHSHMGVVHLDIFVFDKWNKFCFSFHIIRKLFPLVFLKNIILFYMKRRRELNLLNGLHDTKKNSCRLVLGVL